MNLLEAKLLAIDLMEKHNLLDEGWYFEFNNRKRSAGICNYDKQSIELSKPLTELANEADTKDTILHEIAHALVGRGHHHDHVWQRKAREIGCNGDRCYSMKNKPSVEIAFQMVAKYKGICAGKHDHFRNRLPKRNVSCSLCSPRFDERFIITWNKA